MDEKQTKCINAFKVTESTHKTLKEIANKNGIYLHQLIRIILDKAAKKYIKKDNPLDGK